MPLPGLDFLFDVSPYSPRWMCGHWLPAMGWTHIISDAFIFLAYIGIPISLLYYQNKIKALPINYIFYLFAAFIFLCGTTHLLEVIIFWVPIYNFAGLIKFLTAAVSIATLLVIITFLPSTLKFIKEKNDAKIIKLELESLKAEEAQKANIAKDKFLASMSHELRTPLNAIIGYTGTLLMRLPGQLNDEQEKQLKIIQNSSKHLLSLINDILDLSKIQAGKFEVELKKADCIELIQDVVASVIPLCQNKGLEIQFVKEKPEIIINTDPRSFTQIVLNLVHNAIKFTNSGSIRVEALQNHDNEIMVKIIDSGIGIKPEDQHKLFKAFQQIATPDRIAEGTGLGLNLSQQLAHMINGKIEFESSYGKGSCFSLTIYNEEKQ